MLHVAEKLKTDNMRRLTIWLDFLVLRPTAIYLQTTWSVACSESIQVVTDSFI